MTMELTQTNIEKKLTEYMRKVNSIKPPALHGMKYLYHLKRRNREHPRPDEQYGDKSLCEASNLIFSDIVIFLGIKRLLIEQSVGKVGLPFKEYEVALGVEGGHDVSAISGGYSLIGEAFNVAQSLFQSKKSKMIKKLQSEDADYRLIIFNADAVRNPNGYLMKSDKSMLYLPVNIRDAVGDFIPQDHKL